MRVIEKYITSHSQYALTLQPLTAFCNVQSLYVVILSVLKDCVLNDCVTFLMHTSMSYLFWYLSVLFLVHTYDVRWLLLLHLHDCLVLISPLLSYSNIAEALISKGLAYCLRHKQDDDQRSSQYDELMAAEAR